MSPLEGLLRLLESNKNYNPLKQGLKDIILPSSFSVKTKGIFIPMRSIFRTYFS